MIPYNIVAGTDSTTINRLIAQMYQKLYPKLLKTNIHIGALGIDSVDFDINQPPTVILAPSTSANAHFEAFLVSESISDLDDESKATLLDLANAASFDLEVPSIALTINHAGGKPPTSASAALSGFLNVQGVHKNGQNELIVQMVSATFRVPSDPTIEKLLNGIAPPIIDYIDQTFLTPFPIPKLLFMSIQASMPIAVIQDPYITVYSALGANQPEIPPAFPWPANSIFFGADTATFKAALSAFFPMGPSSDFHYDAHIGLGSITGHAGAQVYPTAISINPDGSVTAAFAANASAQLVWHTPDHLPNVTLGPSATAGMSATLLPSFHEGILSVAMKTISVPNFDFNWGISLPLFRMIETGLSQALNGMIQPLLRQYFASLPPFPIYKLDHYPFSFDFEGTNIQVSLGDVNICGENSLLLVEAQPVVS